MSIAESILSSLTEPVLVLDQSFRAVVANPAFYATLQIEAGSLKGKRLHELIGGENGHPTLQRILDTLVASDFGAENVEVFCPAPDSGGKCFSVSARRIPVDEELSERILVELRDITRDKQTQQVILEMNTALQRHSVELEEINTELESFTHSASHDLRTPLRFMNRIAHQLLHEHGAELTPEAVGRVKMILKSTEEMGRLVEKLLQIARVRQEPLNRRRVNLQRLVNEAISQLGDEMDGRQVEITVDELPGCHADRELLKQVFMNLLQNALKFTRPRDRAVIQIGHEMTGDGGTYYVRDNGIGFEMDQSESIFLMFSRASKAHSFDGSGIGLALVKRIIERHNGRIWAESEVDRGATFFFTFDT